MSGGVPAGRFWWRPSSWWLLGDFSSLRIIHDALLLSPVILEVLAHLPGGSILALAELFYGLLEGLLAERFAIFLGARALLHRAEGRLLLPLSEETNFIHEIERHENIILS